MVETIVAAKRIDVPEMLESLFEFSPTDAFAIFGQMTRVAKSYFIKLIYGTLTIRDTDSSPNLTSQSRSLMRLTKAARFVSSACHESLMTLDVAESAYSCAGSI